MQITRAVLALVMAQSIACSQAQTPRADLAAKGAGSRVNFGYVLYGEMHQLSEMRGKPLILVLMRTSDIPSQVYMSEVKEAFHIIDEETEVLVLTIEPSESPFVDLYSESEQLPFPIGVADEAVILGSSPLGKVPVVPSTYFIDGTGRLKYTIAGIVKAETIVQSALKLRQNQKK